MLRRLADDGFASWILAETRRARDRVQALRDQYPAAEQAELAQRLVDEKKKWATTGGAVSGLFGLVTLPADYALVAYLQLSLIVDLAVLCGRNLKSGRAREEVFAILLAANGATKTASRASPKAVARVTERVLAARGLRVFGRLLPLLAAPLTAALNNRDLQLVAEEALRTYRALPRALGARRTGSTG